MHHFLHAYMLSDCRRDPLFDLSMHVPLLLCYYNCTVV